MLKYLRIAVTAFSLTACVMLIALWVRSYYRWDTFGLMTIGSLAIQVESVTGKVIFLREELGNELFFNGLWELDSDDDVDAAEQAFLPGRLGFSYYVEEDAFTDVIVPHWFLILVSTSIAAIPWIPWSRNFSLRTLLIATTLVAVVMGIIVVLL